MKRLSIFVLFILTFMTAYAMADESQNQQNHTSNKSKIVYNSPDDAIMVQAKHPEFTLTLQSNPTTGFSWFLRKYNSNLLTPVSHKFVAPKSKLMGAPGYEVWTFKVLPQAFKVPTVMVLVMVYARPWEKKDGTHTLFRIYTSQS